MCNVCVAYQALRAQPHGYKISWGPKAVVYIRAKGGAELAPAKYQIRRSGEPWSKDWANTSDLAGSFGDFGFDVKWNSVPSEVRDYVLGKRNDIPKLSQKLGFVRSRVICRLDSLRGVVGLFSQDAKNNITRVLAHLVLPVLSLHETLNQKIWDGDKLRPEVRESLLNIANDFYKELEITASIHDIILTGSNANYNYSSTSDLDVHIILDFAEIGKNSDFVTEYMNDKKSIFNDEHNILIHELPVEVYVQDINAPLYAGGVFSLKDNKWIKEPVHEEPKIDSRVVEHKANVISKQIDSLFEMHKAGNNQLVIEKADKLKERIKLMRKAGLEKGGEYDPANLAFKALRNNGYLQKLHDLIISAYDTIRSIK